VECAPEQPHSSVVVKLGMLGRYVWVQKVAAGTFHPGLDFHDEMRLSSRCSERARQHNCASWACARPSRLSIQNPHTYGTNQSLGIFIRHAHPLLVGVIPLTSPFSFADFVLAVHLRKEESKNAYRVSPQGTGTGWQGENSQPNGKPLDPQNRFSNRLLRMLSMKLRT